MRDFQHYCLRIICGGGVKAIDQWGIAVVLTAVPSPFSDLGAFFGSIVRFVTS